MALVKQLSQLQVSLYNAANQALQYTSDTSNALKCVLLIKYIKQCKVIINVWRMWRIKAIWCTTVNWTEVYIVDLHKSLALLERLFNGAQRHNFSFAQHKIDRERQTHLLLSCRQRLHGLWVCHILARLVGGWLLQETQTTRLLTGYSVHDILVHVHNTILT